MAIRGWLGIALSSAVIATGGCGRTEETQRLDDDAGTAAGGADGGAAGAVTRSTGGRAAPGSGGTLPASGGGPGARAGAGGALQTSGGSAGTSGGAGGNVSPTGGYPGDGGGPSSGGAGGQASSGGAGAASGGAGGQASGGVAGAASGGVGGQASGGVAGGFVTDASVADSGAPDASADTGAPDAGQDASNPACLDIKPGGWAPQPTSSPSCTPNCDASSCTARCTGGAPCSAGCCAGPISPNSLTGVIYASLFSDMKVDATGRWHVIVNDSPSGPHYLYGDATGMLGQSSISDPMLPRDAGVTLWSQMGQVAVGPSGSLVHFAYGVGFSATDPIEIRYGALTGSAWSFETLPWKALWYEISDLELDSDGQPLILTPHALYHRTASGWRIEPTPCADAYSELAVDSDGAWYFLMYRLFSGPSSGFLARRSPAGVWTLKSLPQFGARLAVGAGTAHLAWWDDVGVKYSRLVGSTWETRDVLTFSRVNAPREIQNVKQLRFAVDACGSPHMMIAADTYDEQAGAVVNGSHYARWTASGWREAPLPLGCGAWDPFVALAVGPDSAYLTASECALLLTRFLL